MTSNDIDALIHFGRGIFGRDDVTDRLPEVTVPTLILAGEHDRAIPIARHQPMADGIPGARLQIIPGAGHLSTIENPDFVNRTLLSFFQSGRLPTDDGEPTNARTPRSTVYDGALYGRLLEPMLAGVYDFVVGHLPEGDEVLDACCGTGGLARRLADAGRKVVAVDLSPRNIAFASQWASDDLRFEVGDVADLPFSDDRFDCATISMALHEMPHACRVPVLRELGRVARRVMIVDFHAPMPLNAAGLRNRAFEVAAGKDHFSAFRDFSRRGGLAPLIDAADLNVEHERLIDAGTLSVRVVRRRRA